MTKRLDKLTTVLPLSRGMKFYIPIHVQEVMGLKPKEVFSITIERVKPEEDKTADK